MYDKIIVNVSERTENFMSPKIGPYLYKWRWKLVMISSERPFDGLLSLASASDYGHFVMVSLAPFNMTLTEFLAPKALFRSCYLNLAV